MVMIIWNSKFNFNDDWTGKLHITYMTYKLYAFDCNLRINQVSKIYFNMKPLSQLFWGNLQQASNAKLMVHLYTIDQDLSILSALFFCNGLKMKQNENI